MNSENSTQQFNLSMIPATAEHLPVIDTMLKEVRDWLAAKGIRQWVKPFATEWIANRIRAKEFYLAQYKGEIAGTLRFLWFDPMCWGDEVEDAGYVHTLVVRRRYAGLGLGRHMLAWAEQHTLARNIHYLRLDCLAESSHMRQYYQDAGFRPVRELDLEAYGERILLLEKRLDERTTM